MTAQIIPNRSTVESLLNDLASILKSQRHLEFDFLVENYILMISDLSIDLTEQEKDFILEARYRTHQKIAW